MKLLYLIQDKETKKKVVEDFIKDGKNKYIKQKTTNLAIIGVFGVVFGIGMLIYELATEIKWYDYCLYISLILSSIMFIYQGRKIYINKINDYLIVNKKKYKLMNNK